MSSQTAQSRTPQPGAGGSAQPCAECRAAPGCMLEGSKAEEGSKKYLSKMDLFAEKCQMLQYFHYPWCTF